MNIILHDFDQHLTFAPLTLTRPVGDLRTGMWTNTERWQFYMPDAVISHHTEHYLSEQFPEKKIADNLWVNAAMIPTKAILPQILDLKEGESLFMDTAFIAHRGATFQLNKAKAKLYDDAIVLKDRWDLYLKNEVILSADFEAYTKDKKSASLSETNTLIGKPDQLFIEEGAQVECAVLNVQNGPIYIGKNAHIMEGATVRGGLAMAEHSVLKMGAKIYGATSLGMYCKVGGEVSNSIFQAYSNKGHDGFIGNALIGEWCNLGAGTSCSNLKNNYGNVKSYSYKTKSVTPTQQQFMGVAMGDFSKTSINTMLNTATVIGVSSNLFSAGFPAKFIPDFSWGDTQDSTIYKLEKAFHDANQMMKRRDKQLSLAQKSILSYLFQQRKIEG